MNSFALRLPILSLTLLLFARGVHAQQSTPQNQSGDQKFMAAVTNAIPPQPQTMPLYEGAAIPNSKPTPDQEKAGDFGSVQNVSNT